MKNNERIVRVETKLELIYSVFEREVPKLLHSDETPEFDGLLEGLQRRTIDYGGLLRLRQIVRDSLNDDELPGRKIAKILLLPAIEARLIEMAPKPAAQRA